MIRKRTYLVDCIKTNKEEAEKNRRRADIIFNYMDNESNDLTRKTSIVSGMALLGHAAKDVIFNQYNNEKSRTDTDKEKIQQNKNLRKQTNRNISNTNFPKSLTKIEPYKGKSNRPLNSNEYLSVINDDKHKKELMSSNLANLIKNWEFFADEYGKRNYGKEAVENFEMARVEHYLSTTYAKQHKVYSNVNYVEDFLQDAVKKKIISQLGKNYLYDIGGIYIDEKSETSKKIALLPEILNLVSKNAHMLNHNKVISDSVQFTNKNFHNAIGKADILYMRKNIYGDVELYIIDTYEFNPENKEQNAGVFVMAGRQLQQEGYLKPYFIIYSVTIPADIVKMYL